MAATIRGGDELSRRLHAIGDGAAILRKLQIDTVYEAKKLVPRKTGNLGRSIHPGAVSGREAYVRATAGYAAYVEKGTGIYGPRHKPIVPVRAKVLAWRTGAVTLSGKSRVKGGKEIGGWAFAQSVKGRKATPFLLPGAQRAIERGGLKDIVVGLWNEAGLMATTFRADTAAGILAVLNAFIAAHPTLLLAAYRARPESFPDLPAAYIDTRPETITHSQQVRTRTMSPSVVVVRRITNNAEAMAAFDTLVDLLVDAFTAAPQFVTGTIWDQVTVADEDAPFGEYDFAAVRFSFGDVTIMEGRV